MRELSLRVSLFFSLILIFLAITKHLLLGSAVWDLGIFEQFCWLIANKGIDSISSLRGVSPLEDHFSLLLIPIAYLYKIFPSSITLLTIQSISIGSLPYLSLRHQKYNKLYLALLIGIILSPVIFLVNLANFHPEVIATPFMIIALKEVKNRRKVPYYLSLIISLSAKKSQVLFGLGLGIYNLAKGYRKRSLITLLMSILWWFVASNYSSVSGDYIQDRLGYLGNSSIEIIWTLFTKPWMIFSESPIEQIILYSFGLILSFLLLIGKKSIPALIGFAPIYLTNIISSAGSQRELYSQYSIGIIPFLIIGCIDSIEGKRNLSKKLVNNLYKLSIIFALIAFIGYSRIGYFRSRYIPNLSESISLYSLKSKIPQDASILTNSRIGAHFANREFLEIIESNFASNLNEYDYIILPYNLNSNKNDISIIKQAKNAKMTCIKENKYHIICQGKNKTVQPM